jgi:hypothetical protein
MKLQTGTPFVQSEIWNGVSDKLFELNLSLVYKFEILPDERMNGRTDEHSNV